MSSDIRESELLTLKSQVNLIPDDVITIRRTDTNDVSLGLNTIGDFDMYYISTSSPTFGATFYPFREGITGFESNVLTTPISSSMVPEVTIESAIFGITGYNRPDLDFQSVELHMIEYFTPELKILGVTFTYCAYTGLNLNYANITTPLYKSVPNRLTNIKARFKYGGTDARFYISAHPGGGYGAPATYIDRGWNTSEWEYPRVNVAGTSNYTWEWLDFTSILTPYLDASNQGFNGGKLGLVIDDGCAIWLSWNQAGKTGLITSDDYRRNGNNNGFYYSELAYIGYRQESINRYWVNNTWGTTVAQLKISTLYGILDLTSNITNQYTLDAYDTWVSSIGNASNFNKSSISSGSLLITIEIRYNNGNDFLNTNIRKVLNINPVTISVTSNNLNQFIHSDQFEVDNFRIDETGNLNTHDLNDLDGGNAIEKNVIPQNFLQNEFNSLFETEGSWSYEFTQTTDPAGQIIIPLNSSTIGITYSYGDANVDYGSFKLNSEIHILPPNGSAFHKLKLDITNTDFIQTKVEQKNRIGFRRTTIGTPYNLFWNESFRFNSIGHIPDTPYTRDVVWGLAWNTSSSIDLQIPNNYNGGAIVPGQNALEILYTFTSPIGVTGATYIDGDFYEYDLPPGATGITSMSYEFNNSCYFLNQITLAPEETTYLVYEKKDLTGFFNNKITQKSDKWVLKVPTIESTETNYSLFPSSSREAYLTYLGDKFYENASSKYMTYDYRTTAFLRLVNNIPGSTGYDIHITTPGNSSGLSIYVNDEILKEGTPIFKSIDITTEFKKLYSESGNKINFTFELTPERFDYNFYQFYFYQPLIVDNRTFESKIYPAYIREFGNIRFYPLDLSRLSPALIDNNFLPSYKNDKGAPYLDQASLIVKTHLGDPVYGYTNTIQFPQDLSGLSGQTGTIGTDPLASLIPIQYFKYFDREKIFTSSEIPSNLTQIYLTTISTNASGYTFTEVPVLIKSWVPTQTYTYKFYRMPFEINAGNSNISNVIDINDYEIDRTKYIEFRNFENPVFNKPSKLQDFVYCGGTFGSVGSFGTDSYNYIELNNLGVSGNTLINNFFSFQNTYDIDKNKYSLDLFVTPELIADIVLGPTGITAGNYKYWMPEYSVTSVSANDYTGIPTLDDALLTSSSLKNVNWVISNNYESLSSKLGITEIVSDVFSDIAGIPDGFIDGFVYKTYTQKYFSIKSATGASGNAELYVLPFNYKYNSISELYTFAYSNIILPFKYENVNRNFIVQRSPIGDSKSLISYSPIITEHPLYVDISLNITGLTGAYRASAVQAANSDIVSKIDTYPAIFNLRVNGYSQGQFDLSGPTISFLLTSGITPNTTYGTMNSTYTLEYKYGPNTADSFSAYPLTFRRMHTPIGLKLIGDIQQFIDSFVTSSVSVGNQDFTFVGDTVLTLNIGDVCSYEGITIGNITTTNNMFSIKIGNANTETFFDISNGQAIITYNNVLDSGVEYTSLLLTHYPYKNASSSKIVNLFDYLTINNLSFTVPSATLFNAVVGIQADPSNSQCYTVIVGNLTRGAGYLLSTWGSKNTVSLALSFDDPDVYIEYPENTTKNGYNTVYVDIEGQVALAGYGDTYIDKDYKFLISNLSFFPKKYLPRVYLVPKTFERIYKSNSIVGTEFSIQSVHTGTPNLYRLFNSSNANINSVYTLPYPFSNIDVYTKFQKIEYSYPKQLGGYFHLFDSSTVNHGTLNLQGITGVAFPNSSLQIYTNKNIEPNETYNLYLGYTQFPYDSTYPSKIIRTYSKGRLDSSGTMTSLFLRNTILTSTGLGITFINDTFINLLGDNAIVYGSSVLYGYKKTLSINDVPFNDVDILVKDRSVLNTMVDTLFEELLNNGLTGSIIDWDSNYYSTGLYANYLSNLNISPDGITGTTGYNLVSSGVTGGTLMGPFTVEAVQRADFQGRENRNQTTYAEVISIVVPGYKTIQLSYVTENLGQLTLSEYIWLNGDFTVSSGTFDGYKLVLPYIQDVIDNITVYRDPIPSSFTSSLTGKTKFRADWMLSRLQKYRDRGFTIYFQNQEQINTWNLNKSNPYWWTSNTLKPSKTCPFKLLNRIFDCGASPYGFNLSSSISTSEIFGGTITSNPSVYGGTVIIQGFNYYKNSTANSYPVSYKGSQNSIVVMNNTTLCGSYTLPTNGTIPSTIIIPLDKQRLSTGTLGLTLKFIYDYSGIVGNATRLINYQVPIDQTTIKTYTTDSSIYTINVTIDKSNIFGNKQLSVLQRDILVNISGISTFNYKGGWTGNTGYNVNNLVSYDDKLYRCLSITNDTVPPLFNINNWQDTSAYIDFRGSYVLGSVIPIRGVTEYNSTLYKRIGPNYNGYPGTISKDTGVLFDYTTDITYDEQRVLYNTSISNYPIITFNKCIPNIKYNTYLKHQLYDNTFDSQNFLLGPVLTSSNILNIAGINYQDNVGATLTGIQISNANLNQTVGLINDVPVSSLGSAFVPYDTSSNDVYLTCKPNIDFDDYTLPYKLVSSVGITCTNINIDSVLANTVYYTLKNFRTLYSGTTNTYSTNSQDSINIYAYGSIIKNVKISDANATYKEYGFVDFPLIIGGLTGGTTYGNDVFTASYVISARPEPIFPEYLSLPGFTTYNALNIVLSIGIDPVQGIIMKILELTLDNTVKTSLTSEQTLSITISNSSGSPTPVNLNFISGGLPLNDVYSSSNNKGPYNFITIAYTNNGTTKTVSQAVLEINSITPPQQLTFGII